LHELNSEKDALLASVSHELRTPLTAVVGFSQLLQDAADTMSKDERAEIVEMLVARGADLANITNDLLVAAQAEVGALDVTSVPVNLYAQTAQVVEAFERDQAVEIGLIGRSVPATGDPDRIRQIVRNLVSNAFRYGGDAVRVEVLGGGATSSVLVCDNGPVIPDEDRERIFQRFQRARNAPGVAGSLGLGLVISRELAQLMGGDLTYRHENGESVFELSLPRG
jgi:signal transduction histidine kinase